MIRKLSKIIKKGIRQPNNISASHNLTPSPITPASFTKNSSILINKLKLAFLEIQEIDDNIENVDYNKVNDSLMVSIDDIGTFSLSYDENNCLFYLNSPMSGCYSYYYNEEEDKFYSTRDEHILTELLTREILKVCKGYLDL